MREDDQARIDRLAPVTAAAARAIMECTNPGEGIIAGPQ
jgi:hypothetical protein